MTESPTLATILLAAASGARTMTGLAATARRVTAVGSTTPLREPARWLSMPRVATGIAGLAAMELVADKLPGIPKRTDPGPLVGRIVAGGLIGAAIAAVAGTDRTRGALVGAGAAFAGAHLGFQLRRELSEWLPAGLAAVVEDAAVGAVAAAGVSAMTAAGSAMGTRDADTENVKAGPHASR
jgi:uncharacterized membrane protein